MLFLSFSLRPSENTCILASRGLRDKVKKKNHQIYSRDPLSNHLTPWRACSRAPLSTLACVRAKYGCVPTSYDVLVNSNICCICVLVCLCICIFVYALLTHGNIIFDILEQSSFQKYTTCWVFLALRHMLYLCICVFVFVYLCMRHLEISVLISLDQELSENVWFVWSKTS